MRSRSRSIVHIVATAATVAIAAIDQALAEARPQFTVPSQFTRRRPLLALHPQPRPQRQRPAVLIRLFKLRRLNLLLA